jgi:hypothetical protein
LDDSFWTPRIAIFGSFFFAAVLARSFMTSAASQPVEVALVAISATVEMHKGHMGRLLPQPGGSNLGRTSMTLLGAAGMAPPPARAASL